jgi:hypothetical protein
VAYVVGGRDGYKTRLRSYMQLAAVIPLLMVNDIECGPRLTPNEIRRRQLALSLKRTFVLSKDEPKVAALLKSIFALPNDLDQNFLKRMGQPSNRMFKHIEEGAEASMQAEKRPSEGATDDIDMTTLSLSIRGASPTPPVQSIYSLSTFSAPLPAPPSGVRMEGSVAVCTGRRSWSEEWAVLSTHTFSLTSSLTSKHHR